MTGGSTDANGLPDFLTVAYRSATGALLWAKRGGSVSTYDVAEALAVTPNGSTVIVTGRSGGDQLTSAYNAATGARLWSKRVAGGPFGAALDVSPDGSKVFVTSSLAGDYLTIAYRTSTGARLWTRRYSAGRNDYSSDVVASPDGARLFVTGRSEGGTSDDDYATVAYNAATGSQLWVRRYNGPGGGPDAAADVALSPRGSTVFVTGTGSGQHSFEAVTIAYSATDGTRRWVNRFADDTRGVDAVAVAVNTARPEISITGSFGFGGQYDPTPLQNFNTVAYSSFTGAELWSASYEGTNGGQDAATALAVSPEGSRLFVTGSGYGISRDGRPNGNWQFETVAYPLG